MKKIFIGLIRGYQKFYIATVSAELPVLSDLLELFSPSHPKTRRNQGQPNGHRTHSQMPSFRQRRVRSGSGTIQHPPQQRRRTQPLGA